MAERADPAPRHVRLRAARISRRASSSPDEQLVDEARARLAVSPAARDRLASVLVGGAFLVAAFALGAAAGDTGRGSLWAAAVLVGAYAVASRVEFEVGGGAAVPTQLVLVPMLFVLPPAVVPLLVALGFVLSALPDYVRRTVHPGRAFVLLASSWHALGPALVFVLAGVGAPRLEDWWVYVLALGAQFALDAAATATRERIAFGLPPRALAAPLLYAYCVDALLAPVGLLAAVASADGSPAWLLALPVVPLLGMIARERRGRIDRAIESDRAFRAAAQSARLDPLTGLGNRRAWEEAVAAADAGVDSRPACVLLLDLDGLKHANDTLGHDAGDALLCALADVVRAHVRDGDVVARVGGDEIAVLMTRTTAEESADVLARLGAAIDAHPPVAGTRLSASVGSAICPPAPSAAAAQLVADQRMYAGKRERRSRAR